MNEEMHEDLDLLAVGDKVHAWITGFRPADYQVKSIKEGRGSKDQRVTISTVRKVTIEGTRGTVFVLYDLGGVWARPAKRGAKPRKVRELVLASAKRLMVAKAEAADAARRMPSGYTIETWYGSDGIWHRAMLGREPIQRGMMLFGYSDPTDAVIDAWAHKADFLSRELADAIDDHTRGQSELRGRLELAETDARRCRLALQQIGEITRSLRPTCKALSLDYPPEQVVADVAHAKVLSSGAKSGLIKSE